MKRFFTVNLLLKVSVTEALAAVHDNSKRSSVSDLLQPRDLAV